MSIVSHPMLVSFKESIQTKKNIFIVTELVEGKDMFELVKDSHILS
jgi:serine/threonine protein kinase